MNPAADRAMAEPTKDPFTPFRRADPARPFVVAQLGQSLDGRIATITGMSKYINGAPALDRAKPLVSDTEAQRWMRWW